MLVWWWCPRWTFALFVLRNDTMFYSLCLRGQAGSSRITDFYGQLVLRSAERICNFCNHLQFEKWHEQIASKKMQKCCADLEKLMKSVTPAQCLWLYWMSSPKKSSFINLNQSVPAKQTQTAKKMLISSLLPSFLLRSHPCWTHGIPLKQDPPPLFSQEVGMFCFIFIWSLTKCLTSPARKFCADFWQFVICVTHFPPAWPPPLPPLINNSRGRAVCFCCAASFVVSAGGLNTRENLRLGVVESLWRFNRSGFML